jgi:peroxiredoxin
MKRQTQLIISIFLSLCTISCSTKKGFEISAEIDGIQSKKITLFEWSGKKDTIAFSNSNNDKFLIVGQVSSPLMSYIEIQGVNGYIPVFLENSNIEISGDVNDLKRITVSGSESDILYKKFSKDFKEKFISFKDSISTLYKKAEDSNDNTLLENAKQGYGVLYAMQKKFIVEFSKNHLNSPIVPYIMLEELFFRASLDELKDLFNQLNPKVKETKYGKMVDEKILNLDRVAIGRTAPDFEMNDTTGAPISLSTFKGKWVLIDFWSSNCAPCRKENPELVKLYNKYKAKGFEIIGISSDTKKELWVQAIKNDGITWPQVSNLDRSNDIARKLYCWEYNPYNLLVDPNGVIVAKELSINNLEIKLSEAIGH